MPPLCRDVQQDCCDHDTISDPRPVAIDDSEFMPSGVAVDPISLPPSSESYDYPSHLNVSALKFEGCWTEDENDSLGGCERGSLSSNFTIDCENQTAEELTLADDLVLARISSLLLKSSCYGVLSDVRSNVPDLDTSFKTGASSLALNRAVPTIPALSVVHDTSLIIPTTLSSSSFYVQCFPTNEPSSLSYSQENYKIYTDRRPSNPVANLLNEIGIEEVESLNQHPTGPTSGQCQFSCVAMALAKNSGDALQFKNRPDLELRRLALHTISSNPSMYADFLMNATVGRRTRSVSRVANEAGGRGVDFENYLRTMSNPACDGDAVTLQALCDALKITVRIVKPVKADAYQEEWQRERLSEFLSGPTIGDDRQSLNHFASNSYIDDSEDMEAGGLCETETSVSTSARCDSSTWSNAEDAAEDDDMEMSELDKLQRLYISHELQPRQLQNVDARVKDVQRITRGRLVWLSHIGDEAHYRFLRPIHLPSNNRTEAQLSRSFRVARLRNVCSLTDDYVKPKFRFSRSPTELPCCALCLDHFTTSTLHQVVSPSSCCHHYHLECLLTWNGAVSNSCPSCLSTYNEAYFVSNGEIAPTGCSLPLPHFGQSVTEDRGEVVVDRRSGGNSSERLPTGVAIPSFSDLSSWIERFSSGSEAITSRFDAKKVSSFVERLLDFARSKHEYLQQEESGIADLCDKSFLESCESTMQELNTILSAELSQDRKLFCHVMTSLLDAKFLFILRVLLTPGSGAQESADRGAIELLQLLLRFASQGLVLTRKHLQTSGGLLKLLLRFLSKNEHLADVALNFIRCCCRFGVPIPQASAYTVDCQPKAFGSKRSLSSDRTSTVSSSGKIQDAGLCRPTAARSNRRRKHRASASDKTDAPSKKKRPTPKVLTVKKIVTKKVDPPIPAHLLPQPVCQRAPGKRQIKPVATTNISHEHLALRCYRGAL